MSRACDVCGKKPTTGNTISHANNHSRRRFKPNIQKVRVSEDGHTVQRTVCTRCIRSGKVDKRV